MPSALPLPVLSVTADAVRDLDGREALSGLWTLFTKCKESLQDGRRLENISWRLWYRELQQPLCPNLDSGMLDDTKEKSPLSSPLADTVTVPLHPTLGQTGYSYFTQDEAVPVLPLPAYLYSTLHIQGASSLNLRKPTIADLQPTSNSTSTSTSSSLTVTPPKGDSLVINTSNSTFTPNTSQSNTNSTNNTNTSNTNTTTTNTPAQQQQISINTLSSIPQLRASSSSSSSASLLHPNSHPHLPHASHSHSHSNASHSHSNASHSHSSLHSHSPHSHSHSQTHLQQQKRPDIIRSSTSSTSMSSARTERSPMSEWSSIDGGGYALGLNSLNESRGRRSSFAGLRVGEIICDMLPPTPPSSVPGSRVNTSANTSITTTNNDINININTNTGNNASANATYTSTTTSACITAGMTNGISDPNVNMNMDARTGINIDAESNQAPVDVMPMAMAPHRVGGSSGGSGVGDGGQGRGQVSTVMNGQRKAGFRIGGMGGSSVSSTSSASSISTASSSGSASALRSRPRGDSGAGNGAGTGTGRLGVAMAMAPGIVMTPLGWRNEGETEAKRIATGVGLLTPETEDVPEQRNVKGGLQHTQHTIPSVAAVAKVEVPVLLTPTSISSPSPTPDSTPEENGLKTGEFQQQQQSRPQAPHVTVASDAFAAHVAMFGDVAAGQIARTLSVGVGMGVGVGAAPGQVAGSRINERERERDGDKDRDREKDRDRDNAVDQDRNGENSESRYPAPGDVDAVRGVGEGREDAQQNQPESQQMPSHSQSPSSSDQPQQPPLLVVVNPTPNLTPHPTPPSTPVLGALGRQWLMLPGQQRAPVQSEELRVMQQMPMPMPMLGRPYQLQQAQLAQLLPPLTIPPHAGVRPHLLAAYGTDDASGAENTAMIHAQGNGRNLVASSDRAEAEESPAFGHEGTVGGSTSSNGLAHAHAQPGMHGLVRPHAQLVSQEGMGSHAHYHYHLPAQENAGIADVNLSPFARAGERDAAQPLLPHLAHTLSGTPEAGSEYELKLHGQVLSHHGEGGIRGDKPKTSTTNLGGVGAARDNVNRRSISSTTSTSSHTTSASSQSTRSRVTASSSATSASGTSSIGSKNTLGGGVEAHSNDEGKAQSTVTTNNKWLGMVDSQMTKGATGVMAFDKNAAIATDGWRQEENVGSTQRHENEEALEEEEDDPLSPLPTATSFALSHSPKGDRDYNRSKGSKRHSAPPKSTSDSVKMRIALSLSPSHAPPVPPGQQSNDIQELQEESSQAGQPTALPRTRSVSSTRSVTSAGKRNGHSTANKRKGNMGPPPVPLATTSATTATSTATNVTRTASKAVGAAGNNTTAPVRRSSSTRSTSRSGSVGGSSLGDSRSRSRDAGLGLGLGLGMTTTTSTAAVAPARTRTATRGRAKFVLGRAGNKKNGGLLRRNSSGMDRTKTKQKEEQEDDDDDDDDDDGYDGVDQGELEKEVVDAQTERVRRELEARERIRIENDQRERDRMFAQEQARRAALAEEEKRRRRELERQQALINTLTALAPPPTADTASETSSRPPKRFNIGSNSDDGMGSKSAGSGSDASGAVGGQSVRGPDGVVMEGREKGKGKEVLSEQQQHLQQHQHQHQHLQRYQNAYPLQQQHHQHVPVQLPAAQYIQTHGGEISKEQLRQLEGIQQMHQKNHSRANIAQMQQYKQQFQPPLQQHAQQVRLPPTGPSRQATMTQAQIAAAVAHATNNEKGKQREVTVAPMVDLGKSKKGNNSAHAAHVDVGVDASILAKVKESLNTPLLPTGKKRVELVPSESEFETTDDEVDDGDWSSTGDDEDLKQAAQEENEKIKALANQIRQMELGQRQQQPPVRPPGVQRTHSSHYPPGNNARGKQAVRQQQQRQAQAAQAVVNQAMIEAQRQRDMFVKLPTSSFQDLAKARARSVGLLSQLMNPDPETFPVNHPYRRGLSSQEVRRGGISAMAPMQPMTPARTTPASAAPAPVVLPTATAVPPAAPRPPVHRRTSTDATSIRSTFSPPLRSSGLATSKSAAALPMATQVQVGSVSTMNVTAAPTIDRPSGAPGHVQANRGMSGGYRPRGPPVDVDLESDSDDGGITMSKSVAQEKLKVLAQRRGIQPAAGPSEARPSQQQPPAMEDNDVPPHWAMVSPRQPQQNRGAQPSNLPTRRVPAGLRITHIQDEPRTTHPPPATAPIAVEYPYNLPIAVPPSTPRTVRRRMLSTEMSESLRRNLLWLRQSTRNDYGGLRRTASSGGTTRNSNNVLSDGVRPLTAAPSMVQLHAKGTKAEGTSQIQPRIHPPTEEEREARRLRAANNKSYDDYHYSGW